MLPMTIDDIIRAAGGASAIARASRDTRKPISGWAVHRWRNYGIPRCHWGLLMQLAPSLTVDAIYRAHADIDGDGRSNSEPSGLRVA